MLKDCAVWTGTQIRKVDYYIVIMEFDLPARRGQWQRRRVHTTPGYLVAPSLCGLGLAAPNSMGGEDALCKERLLLSASVQYVKRTRESNAGQQILTENDDESRRKSTPHSRFSGTFMAAAVAPFQQTLAHFSTCPIKHRLLQFLSSNLLRLFVCRAKLLYTNKCTKR